MNYFMDEQNLQHILAFYGIKNAKIQEMQTGYRNLNYPFKAVGKTYNLIIYKNEPNILNRIKNANFLGNYLAKAGFPARTTANPKILQAKSRQVRFCCLYTYMPGKTISWEAYEMEHLKALGESMGLMHAQLQKLPKRSLPFVTEDYVVILKQAKNYFENQNVQAAMGNKLHLKLDSSIPTNFIGFLKKAAELPGQQPLHMDFVRGNILFENKTVSGVLDFEKAAYGHPAFDIARTLAFLLVDCKYKQEAKIRKYFLQSGYIKRGGRSLVHIQHEGKDVLETLISLFLLHDFYKFLLHNPYESLEQNEHFVRTRNILLKRSLITLADAKIASNRRVRSNV